MNELKEASLADGLSEPNLSLFVIKQVTIPNIGVNKIGFGLVVNKEPK